MLGHLFKTLLSDLKSGKLPSIVGFSISKEQARQINEILLLRKKEIDDYVKFMINPHLESPKGIHFSPSQFGESDNTPQIGRYGITEDKRKENEFGRKPSHSFKSVDNPQVHYYNVISEEERKQNEFERVPSESSRFS